jgi:LysM repeat protein
MRRRMMVLVGVVMASLLVSTSVAAAPAVAAPAALSAPGYHMVRVGETLSSIGRLYGVSAWAIASANHLRNPNHIYAGQWLQIPRGSYAPPGGWYPYPPSGGCCAGGYPAGGRFHWVKHGETMLSIGRLYGMSPWVIASANGIYNLNCIYAGQRLVIPYHRA